ncbi:MAG: tyrosine-type recombinase/integrase [Candidatus Aminicenantes bacterium]|nr:tyrosine-type recombinase/integrase [Candidatus Aminicenantes bacterium]
MEVAKSWLQELIVFDVNTGLRPGSELLQELKWENISFEDSVAYLEKTKSGESKTAYLNSVALDILKKRQGNVGNGKGAVFGYSYYTVRAAFKRACKRAGIEGVTLHTFRHSFGTRLIENGADIVTAKDLLHHSSLEMTERYTHPDNKRNRDAVERLVQKGSGAVT